MDIKIVRVIMLIAIAGTFCFSTCRKGSIGGCATIVYSFQMKIKAYPDQDSMHVGDTLWLEINSPTALKDQFTDDTIDYSKAQNLGTAIGFGQFTKRDSSIDAANSFSYLLLTGTSVQNSSIEKIREYLFTENDNRYLFKLAVIPKYKGIFGFGVSDAANVYRETDKCTKAFFNISFDNTHQHYYLNPNIVGSGEDTLSPSGSYNFKVY